MRSFDLILFLYLVLEQNPTCKQEIQNGDQDIMLIRILSVVMLHQAINKLNKNLLKHRSLYVSY